MQTELYKATDSTAVKSSGRQAISIVNELEGVNNRQMGIENSKGFQIPYTSKPLQDHRPDPAMYSPEQNLLIQEEVGTLIERN